MTTPSPRLPANYRLVHEILSELEPGHHLAAEEILARVRARKPRFGLSTVYRALERLSALELIKPVHVRSSSAVLYEAACADHSHFVCRGCGRVDDIALDLALTAIGAELDALDCKIEEIAVTVHGLCRRCRGASL